MRADVCNARYGLAPAEHCEYYREHEAIEDAWLTDDGSESASEERTAGDCRAYLDVPPLGVGVDEVVERRRRETTGCAWTASQ